MIKDAHPKAKAIVFSLILVTLGLIILELSIRGAFVLVGRYGTWGYPSQNKSIAPYVGFLNRADNGRDRYGFRLDSDDDPKRDLSVKASCEFRIFLLGGSTVAGRVLKGQDDSLPARIEALLNQEQMAKIMFSVVNAGVGGYTSPQSLMKHIMYIRYSFRPDFIVHFNGSNDSVGSDTVFPRGYYAGVRDNLHSHTENVFRVLQHGEDLRVLASAFRKLADISALIFVIHKSIYDPESWRRFFRQSAITKNNSETNQNELPIQKWVDKHVDRYIYNMSVAATLGTREVGVGYFFQPTLLRHLRNTPSPEEEVYLQHGLGPQESFHGYDRRVAKKMFYQSVSEKIPLIRSKVNSPYSVVADLSAAFKFEPSSKMLYSDHVHYTSVGREILSKKVSEIIRPVISSQIINSDRFGDCLQ